MPGSEFQHRQLVAIMFTDMVGYSAIAREDEKLALELLAEHQRILREIFPRFHGREISTIGDAFLVEFTSAVKAVECAVAIQQALRSRNAETAERRRIRLRIGLHVGDIVREEKDVTGDAVNEAARIYPLASPGGIYLTEDVVRQIRGKSDIQLQRMGQAKLKNVHPNAIHRVILPWERKSARLTEKVAFAWRQSSANWVAAGGVGLLILAGLFAWRAGVKSGWWPNTVGGLDKLRIAVLPFSNLSPDKSHNEYIAGGMTEALISKLGEISDLKVIARTSIEKYKDTRKDIAQIGQELGVGTVVEGSVSRDGDKIRVIVSLIDVLSQAQHWARTYDKDYKDVFAIQSQVAEQVVGALKVRLPDAERQRINKRQTGNLQAYDLYLAGREHWQSRSDAELQLATNYLQQAIALDPSFALAYAGLADCYIFGGGLGRPPNEYMPEAERAARKALELDPNLAEAHAALARIKAQFYWDWDGAGQSFRTAIALKNNYATAHYWYGAYCTWLGDAERAVAESKMALSLDGNSAMISTSFGATFLELRQWDEARRQLAATSEKFPRYWGAHYWLGWVHVHQNAFAPALASFEQAHRLDPTSTTMAAIAYCQAASGNRAGAEKTINELASAQYGHVPAYEWALIYCALDDKPRALDWLEKAFDERGESLVLLKVEPAFDKISGEERFTAFLKRIGLNR